MKRLALLFLISGLLLSGCSFFSEGNQQPVLFYYPCAEYLLGQSDGAIAVEERDGTGHITDIEYLLRLYLAGPHSEALTSPFPGDVQLTSVRPGQDRITVKLSGTPETTQDALKTLGYACLTLTCLELTEADSVMILWGDEHITMDRSCLTLFDDSAPIPN